MTSEARTLSARQQATLAALLDTLVPPCPERGRPGAGELGLAAPVCAALDDGLGLGALLVQTLDALDAQAGPAAGFAALELEDRERLLNALSGPSAGLLSALVYQSYVHYYEQPRVVEALGLEARPPFPRGHALEPGDLGPLEAVRRRGKLYRDA